MHLMFVLPNLGLGGAERITVDLVNYYCRQGHHVSVVSLHNNNTLKVELNNGVRFYELNLERIIYSIPKLYKIFISLRPDRIFGVMWPVSFVTLLAATCARIHNYTIMVEHTTWSSDPILKSSTQKLIFKFTFRLASIFARSIITVSQNSKDDLIKLAQIAPAKIRVINNFMPVDLKYRNEYGNPSQAAISEWLNSDKKRILAIGNLKKAKDYGTLIHSFKKLITHKDARLLILGEGPERNGIERLILEFGLTESVYLGGSTTAVYKYLKAADVFVLSSEVEGFPVVLLEALAVGVPIVSTNCPSGPAEILENGKYGLLVAVGDAQGMASAIEIAIDEPHRFSNSISPSDRYTIQQAALDYLR